MSYHIYRYFTLGQYRNSCRESVEVCVIGGVYCRHTNNSNSRFVFLSSTNLIAVNSLNEDIILVLPSLNINAALSLDPGEHTEIGNVTQRL